MTRVVRSHLSPAVETVSHASHAPTTLVVDGNYLLKCSVHATEKNPEYIVNGRHIGAVKEFLRKLRELVGQLHITKCVVFWDGEHGGKLRHNIYPYYKANRKNKQWYRGPQKSEAQAQDDARSQRSIEAQKVRIQMYLEELFVRQTEQAMMEGDDMIAYYCQNFYEQERIVIFTNDRDMCQLLTLNGVSIYLNNLKLLINRDNFDIEFPYHYSNAALVKIFCGDTSDNIKGVLGVGAQTLLEHFPRIKNETVTVAEIVAEARAACETRRLAKKKPIQKIENIAKGIAMRLHAGNEEPYEFGEALYELNTQLMDLSQPMLTREAREDVLHMGDLVFNRHERGTKNLLPMVNQDHMLRFYSGDLRRFVEPFFPLVAREHRLYEENEKL